MQRIFKIIEENGNFFMALEYACNDGDCVKIYSNSFNSYEEAMQALYSNYCSD